MSDTKQQALAQGLIPITYDQCLTTDFKTLIIGHDDGETEIVDAESCCVPQTLSELLALRAEALGIKSLPASEYERTIGELQAKLQAAEERAEKAESEEATARDMFQAQMNVSKELRAKLAKVQKYCEAQAHMPNRGMEYHRGCCALASDILAVLDAKPTGPCCGDEYGDKVTLPGEEG